MERNVAKTASGLACVAAAASLISPPSAGAETSPEPGNQHCVLTVEADGNQLLVEETSCYPTLAEALAESGPPIGGAPDNMRSAALAASTIAVHFDGRNQTGASIFISGTECAGGYLNLTAAWTNRIRSTVNFCPTVRFFDGFDKSGDSEPTSGTQNLGPLDLRSNSVSYA